MSVDGFGGGPGWIFTTAVRGVLGQRPLGDPFSPGQTTFGPFFSRVRAAQVERGTLAQIPAAPAPQPEPGRPPIKVVSTPPLIPAPALPPGTPGSIPPRPYPGIPGLPGGPSIPDRIPGIPAAGSIVGRVLSSVIRGGWAGLLFYPREAGRGSALCVETQYGPYCPPVVQAVPAAVPLPGRGPRTRPRRIPGTVAPPRRRERGRVVAPPAPAIPRGRPVTISRPIVIPQPRVVTGQMPAPRSLPPPVTSFPMPGNVARPAAIPATRPAALPAIAQFVIPAILASVFSQTAAAARAGARSIPGQIAGALPGLSPAVSAPPQLGRVELPNLGSFPQPLPGLATQPLTSFQTAAAQSPAQELDRQCRERAKQKRKKRKPKDRTVCYRGTFYELKKGTRKQRREKIKCR